MYSDSRRRRTRSRSFRTGRLAATVALVLSAGALAPTALALPVSPTKVEATNTSFSNGLSGWSEITSAGTARVITGRTGRSARVSHVRSTATTVTLRAPRLTPRTLAGGSYTATIWVRASRATTVNLRLLETTGRATVSQLVTTNVVGTGWTEIGINHTARSTGASMYLFVTGDRLARGAWLDVDDLAVNIRQPQWADEFNGNALDRSSWNVLDNAAVGAANNEQSCYFDRPENVTVSGGALQLIGRSAANTSCGAQWPQQRNYTSGFVNTADKKTFTYGRFEMRAKLPTGRTNSQGLWTAFWLWPQDQGPGELDVVEAIGTSAARPGEWRQVHQFIHYDGKETHPQQGQAYVFRRGIPSDGYHVYALEWTPTRVLWFIDGAMTYKRDLTTTPWIKGTFTRPMHLKLNLTVGAAWPGTPNAATTLPAVYAIDYVRVFR